jgi:putative nucleotidyltransferase with HDIG domain
VKNGTEGKKMSHDCSRLRAFYSSINKELLIIFLLVAITGIIFFFVSNQRAFLNFMYLPVILGAYFYGKRYATLAALLSLILISVVAYVYPATFSSGGASPLHRWLDIGTWGAFLLITAYLMGLLYEKKERTKREIRNTYQGIIEMLSLVIDSVDQHTHSHSYRVSALAERIAKAMGCAEQDVENIRIAALLHDLGKIGVSREILVKAGELTREEREHMKGHTVRAAHILKPLGGRVTDLLPMILGHHEKYDGKGYYSLVGEDIPLGARIIAVADVFDALTSDRPYREAIPAFVAKEEIVAGAGTHFDPGVVKVFVNIFSVLERGDVSASRALHA